MTDDLIKFGSDVVQIQEHIRLGDEPVTHEQLITSGDLTRAGLRRHDFRPCPLCGESTLTSHERRISTGICSASVWCRGCMCTLKYNVSSIYDLAEADIELRKRWNSRTPSL